MCAQSNSESTEYAVKTRFLKLPFAKLDRQVTFPDDFPEPPCNTSNIGLDMQTLISWIGPHLSCFDTERSHVEDCLEFLEKLTGRVPERQDKIAATTLAMTLQIYHAYTSDTHLEYIVKWFDTT